MSTRDGASHVELPPQSPLRGILLQCLSVLVFTVMGAVVKATSEGGLGVPPGHWRIALRGWNDMKMFGVSEKVLAPDLGVIDVTDASTIERPLDVTAVLNAPPPTLPPFRK